MKRLSNNQWFAAAAFLALVTPAAMLHAQGGGRSGAAALAKDVPAPTSPVTGNAAAGKKLYYDYGCYACHGYNGETGARPFVGSWGNLATEQGFLSFLRGRA